MFGYRDFLQFPYNFLDAYNRVLLKIRHAILCSSGQRWSSSSLWLKLLKQSRKQTRACLPSKANNCTRGGLRLPKTDKARQVQSETLLSLYEQLRRGG